MLWHKNFLYSVSYDGSVKMWDATNLELVMEVKKAHDGQRIKCGAVGPDGCLYTGGDDKVGVLLYKPSLMLSVTHFIVRLYTACVLQLADRVSAC